MERYNPFAAQTMESAFMRRIHINLNWEDIVYVAQALDHLTPGGRMYIENGNITFLTIEAGTTKRGVIWRNNHKTHRENCTYNIRARALPWLVGKGIDIGCGIEKVKDEDCIGTDNGEDFGDRGDADVVCDSTDLGQFSDGQFDWVYSSNNLEHIERWEKAMDEYVRVLKPGGTIFLYLPWADRCYLQAAGREIIGHRWNPSPEIIRVELDKRGVDILECDPDIDDWGCFVIVGRKQ